MKRILMTTLLAASLVAPAMMPVSAAPAQSQQETNKQQLKEQKAKDKWEQAEVKHGKNSKQALDAKAKYEKVVAQNKGIRQGERKAS